MHESRVRRWLNCNRCRHPLQSCLRRSTSQRGRRTKAVELEDIRPAIDYVASCTAVNSMAMFIYAISYKFGVAIRLDTRVQTAHVSSQDCWVRQCSQVRLPHLVGRCDDYQVHTCIRKTWRARGIFSFRVMDCCWRVWHCSFIMTKSSTSQRCVVYAVCWCINPRHCRRMVWKCPVWRCRW